MAGDESESFGKVLTDITVYIEIVIVDLRPGIAFKIVPILYRTVVQSLPSTVVIPITFSSILSDQRYCRQVFDHGWFFQNLLSAHGVEKALYVRFRFRNWYSEFTHPFFIGNVKPRTL